MVSLRVRRVTARLCQVSEAKVDCKVATDAAMNETLAAEDLRKECGLKRIVPKKAAPT